MKKYLITFLILAVFDMEILVRFANCWLCQTGEDGCICTTSWDINKDGIVNWVDYNIFINNNDK